MRSFPGVICATALAAFLLAVVSPASGEEPSGVEGVAAFRGDFVSGATVLVFLEAGPGPTTEPLAVSEGTDESGRYRLLLDPGSYYLAAVKSGGEPWPFRGSPGDLFCYYLGNPIVVEPGKMTRVGFNLVRMGEVRDPVESKGSGIGGRVLFEDEPLGRAYVHVYRDRGTNFRGMGLAALPTGEDGRFRLKLPPGRYYLLARKRQGGGMYGPPGKDDYIAYYPGNPVEVRQGFFGGITIEATTRVDLLEEIWFTEGKGAGWFEGVVSEASGKAVAGLYVLFYKEAERAGTPAFVAGPTDEGGRFRVRAAEGPFYLTARSGLGGPVEQGGWYGTWRGPGGGEALKDASGGEIRIEVGPFGAGKTP
jgi:hypothetical protein